MTGREKEDDLGCAKDFFGGWEWWFENSMVKEPIRRSEYQKIGDGLGFMYRLLKKVLMRRDIGPLAKWGRFFLSQLF